MSRGVTHSHHSSQRRHIHHFQVLPSQATTAPPTILSTEPYSLSVQSSLASFSHYLKLKAKSNQKGSFNFISFVILLHSSEQTPERKRRCVLFTQEVQFAAGKDVPFRLATFQLQDFTSVIMISQYQLKRTGCVKTMCLQLIY